MEIFLQVFLLLPLLGYVVSLLLPAKKERWISWSAVVFIGTQLYAASIFFVYWLLSGHKILNLKEISLYSAADYSFVVDFYYDKITAVYMLLGAGLTFLISIYSRAYMHREEGFKRFYSTIQFFYFGYNLTILSGNFETLFLGWEILGLSSFLLIAFYRDRYLPVKNAVKTFSIYRVGDVGLLLAMWLSHHLWHENITFLKLNSEALVSAHLQEHSLVGVFISLAILLSATAKSAQLPFSSWLPRAMEGPTPSSAIFYGSLSVHIGVFLLLRTYTFWEYQFSVRVLIAVIGLMTSLIATGIARVQSSVKSQVAYASIAQIGLMFIEISLGWKDIALYHFAGNAFLRTYQLLVSPSVVSYLIREQFYNYSPDAGSVEDSFPKRIRYMLYVLCLKEWNLDSLMYRYLWNPIKWAGRKLDFLNFNRLLRIFVPMYVIGLVSFWFEADIPAYLHPYLSLLYAGLGLVSILKSFAERIHVRTSWALIAMNHLWVALAISFNEHFTFDHILLYLSGIAVASVVGYICLHWLKANEQNIDLDRFHGHAYEYPKLGMVFLLACLGITGFPISPTFVGEDLIFSHIHAKQLLLASFVSLSFILDGLSAMRIYARVFLGPHIKTYHEVAYRSS